MKSYKINIVTTDSGFNHLYRLEIKHYPNSKFEKKCISRDMDCIALDILDDITHDITIASRLSYRLSKFLENGLPKIVDIREILNWIGEQTAASI